MKKRFFKFIAKAMLVTLTYQLVFPACAYALTTGPSQPEVQSFEPVGTTDMVDMFSGDFNYNIPLMDVEGYPINIFYHSGVGIEQEASWVGLGWNINPGEINRSVRGLPDDFNGETIEKFTKIKEEKDIRIGIGVNVAAELIGKDIKDIGVSAGSSFYVAHNNYRGLSAGISNSIGIKVPFVSLGVSVGIGSQSGADMDFNATASVSQELEDEAGSKMSLSAGVGSGFNSRTGLKDISFSVTPSMSVSNHSGKKGDGKREYNYSGHDVGSELSTSIPIGMQNYVPVITNQVSQSAYSLQLKAGGEFYGAAASVYVDATISNIKYNPDGSRSGYGFFYAENAKRESIMDFSRDKDITYNETMKNLPLGCNTYDVYSVNGQGTGGMFRPYRNDIGTFSDPYVDPGSDNENFNGLVEAGIGNLFEIGGDLTTVRTRNECGAWVNLPFGKNKPGTLYEKLFFKHGGDMSYNQQQEAPQLFNIFPQYLQPDLSSLVSNSYKGSGKLPAPFNGSIIFWDNNTIDRSSRSTYISYKTAEEIEKYNEPDFPKTISSYENGTLGKFYDPKIKNYGRHTKSSTGTKYNSQAHQISEFTQTQSDGRRYVYGIPAINNVSREVTFAIDESKANLSNGYVGFTRGVDDGMGNTKGKDNYYSTTNTPSYTHSYLLTEVLSNDYVDILGDGSTDDDLGSFTKINYTLSDSDYRWRTPYHKDSAQFNPGFHSDKQDGKGNYMVGSRQQWYIRSVESKNYIAEFYTSKRKDGLGIQSSVLQSDSKLNIHNLNLKSDKSDSSFSYKLDSIKLYNKHDRYINKENAVAVKTVILQYDYSLCQNTPNSVDATKGKLTLKRIYIRYGNSQKNLLSPYVFNYQSNNPVYDFSAKDSWGNYKVVKPGSHNYEFPYTDQPMNSTEEEIFNAHLSSWNLTDIRLPSGGKIHVDFESDDYAYVQDKRAMQMLNIAGVGSSEAFKPMNILYIDLKNINDYLYFKRQKSKERPGLTMAQNYMEGQEFLNYNFNLDISGKGNYENIKGYARFDKVGICSVNDDYGFIKIRRDDVKGIRLHPATVYGINMARFYLPHIFYDGYQENSNIENVIKGLFASGKELLGSVLLQNPFKRWVEEKRGKMLNVSKSFVRVQTPSMAKKGGGIRVKQLTLSDNWDEMTGNQNADFGKKYDYTIKDSRYGVISSGVASYEPMIGGEENPLHSPVPYDADRARLLPAIRFFQEEPFGESFYPGPSVGYSSVKVSSIHQEYARSAQAIDEYLFYTAKDYPVKVDYTQIGGDKNKEVKQRKSYVKEVELTQGYSIVLNDMHGKQKAVNNYTVHEDGSVRTVKKITGVSYKYFEDEGQKCLNNKVSALLRKRGEMGKYELHDVILGQDIDFSLDSRQRKTETFMTKTNLNLNVFLVGIFPIIPFTVFHVNKDKTIAFKSLVTTKIIQQYGIVKSIEQFDHDATTTTENLVFDGETGGVLLTRTNNQFNDYTYTRNDPAYLAYEGMKSAYTNNDYEEVATSLVVDNDRNGFLYTNHLERYSPGDELWVKMSEGKFKDVAYGNNPYMKLWVLSNTGGKVCYPSEQTQNVSFWKADYDACHTCIETTIFTKLFGSVNVNLYNASAPATLIASGTLNTFFNNTGGITPVCSDSLSYLKFNIAPGTYNYTITGAAVKPSGTHSGTFTIIKGKGVSIGLQNCRRAIPTDNFEETISCNFDFGPCFSEASSDSSSPCALLVAPRYKDRFAAGTTTPNLSRWPQTYKKYDNVEVKIIRSGRRNNLTQMIQQTTFADPMKKTLFYTNTKDYFEKSDNVIATSVSTYTDSAQNFTDFDNEVDIPFVKKYAGLNPYVLGLSGNYRPLAAYAPIVKRSYEKDHSRFNGTYIINPFWIPPPPCISSCRENKVAFMPDILSPFWKRASIVTRYDPNGNAIEEKDAIGNFSAAQYGYNRLLPVAVASNVRAQHIMFDGFEDYNMLLPQTTAELYKKRQLHNLLGWPFAEPVSSVTGDYPSEQSSGDPAVFTRSGQRFYLMQKAPSGLGMELSNDASHTGNYSLKCSEEKSITFNIKGNVAGSIDRFSLEPEKNYIVNFWAKSTSSTPVNPSMFTSVVNPSSTSGTTTFRTGNIDGWVLVQVNVNLKEITSGVQTEFVLNLPAGVYIDDLRLLPVSSNMKSFVYDPITFKLTAQLDENHFATLFEYDQEGLLIRTKKETARGIMTISESRRSNAKQH